MAIIKKKTWPELFEKIASGEKNFDLRIADFNVEKNDILVFEEYNPETKTYTGRKIEKKIKFVLKTKDQEFWPEELVSKYGFIAMGLEDVHSKEDN